MTFRKQLTLVALVAVVTCCMSSLTSAQFYGRGAGNDRIARPLGNSTVSPYVNLLRQSSGAGFAGNYYGGVRQGFETRELEYQFQRNYGRRQQGGFRNQQGISPHRYSGLSQTGHPVVFGSLNGQFGASGLSGRQSGGGLPPTGHAVSFRFPGGRGSGGGGAVGGGGGGGGFGGGVFGGIGPGGGLFGGGSSLGPAGSFGGGGFDSQ